MPPLLSAGSRYFVAAIILAAFLAAFQRPQILRIDHRQLLATSVAGIGIIGIWAALISLALQHITSGAAAIIGATVPVWVVLLRITAGERVGWPTTIGVALGIGGIIAMLWPGGIASISNEAPATVSVWAGAVVVASMTYAFFSWKSRTLNLPEHALVSTAYQLLWGGGVVIIMGLVIGERVEFETYSSVSWSGFAWLVFASIAGYGAYTYLLRRAPLSLVSTFAYVNPVVAVILGWVLLSEPFTRSVVIGIIVVITGTALIVLDESRSPQPTPGEPRRIPDVNTTAS